MLAIDTETFLIEPGVMFPRFVVASAFSDGLDILTKSVDDFRQLLFIDNVVMHNSAFDIGVAVFCGALSWKEAFDFVGSVSDTMIREKLLDLSEGKLNGWINSGGKMQRRKYSLADLTRKYLKKHLEKDEWRLRYSELADVPLEQWPQGATHYAREDAKSTFEIWKHQETRRQDLKEKFGIDPLQDETRQIKRLWALTLMARHGIMTSEDSTEKLIEATERRRFELAVELIDAGLVRDNGQRNTKAAKARIHALLGEETTLTPKGEPCLDADSCKESGDDLLKMYSEYSSLGTVLSKDVEALKLGHDVPIHTRINSLLETGRPSSSGPNLFNIRALPGIRECFVPRDGYWFLQVDYSGLELCTLAQVLLVLYGRSRLADVINKHGSAGAVHTEFAVNYLGVPKGDPNFYNARQTAKVANFGFPGGLGYASLVRYARAKYGVVLTEEKARELKGKWLDAWPEMRMYFNDISNRCHNGRTDIVQLFSNRIRGGCRYTEACNTYFQGLGADATGLALFEIQKRCFSGDGPLSVCRLVNYVYDEFILEVPADVDIANAAKEELAEACATANEFLPDVPVACDEFVLMNKWSKEAKPVFDEQGRLIPWN